MPPGEMREVPRGRTRFDEGTLAALNPAFIRFSSGTTGASKGIVLSHESLLARVTAANRGLRIGPGDRVVWILPMAHHFAVSIMLYLLHGATTVIENSHLAEDVLTAGTQTRRHRALRRALSSRAARRGRLPGRRGPRCGSPFPPRRPCRSRRRRRSIARFGRAALARPGDHRSRPAAAQSRAAREKPTSVGQSAARLRRRKSAATRRALPPRPRHARRLSPPVAHARRRSLERTAGSAPATSRASMRMATSSCSGAAIR